VSILTAEFSSAADPSLSFDAKRILFAGKRSAGESWNIWEMNIDGSTKRQLTKNFGNCLEPSYVATSSITAPEFDDKVRWMIFTSDQTGAYEERGQDLARAIYAQNTEPIAGRGTVTWRTTYNLSSDFSPTVLGDGRIVFTSTQPGGGDHAQGRYPLLATNWDGTGLNLFLSSHEGPVLKTMACEMPDRTIVFVESSGESRDGAGQLARVSLQRPLHSREALSKGEGTYLNPKPLPDGRILVAFSKAGEGRAICLFDPATGSAGQAVHQDRNWDDQAAIAVSTRPEPQGLISAVVEPEKTADLHCINAYESDLPGAGQIKQGDIKRVRFVQGIPAQKSEAVRASAAGGIAPGHVRTRILGEVPVEDDGSFYVRLAGDTPFYVQLLDSEGMSLQTQRGWIWVRRGTSRQCLGCHENKELAPENRVTDALLKMRRHLLTATPEQRRPGADFRHAVMPVIQAKCRSCHDRAKAPGGLDLSDAATKSYNRAYESLMADPKGGTKEHARFILPGSARRSPLINLLSEAKSAQGSLSKHPAVHLDSNEKRTLVEWIDLGALWEN